MNDQQQNKIDSWINFPRHILSLLRNGHLTRHEYQMYMYLRHNCNPYSIATTSTADLINDVFGGKVSDSYISKLLLSLRSKELIWYRNRQGVKGSFEVHFGDFILPTGKITSLDGCFNPDKVRSETDTTTLVRSEVTPEVAEISQKLKEKKNELISRFSLSTQHSQVRSYNTDNDNKKKNDITDRSALKTFNKEEGRNLKTQFFYPDNSDEQIIWEIAHEIGEEDMKFLFSIHRKHGIALIERAYGQFKETRSKETIDNPPAYLNKIIQRLISEKEK